MPVNRLLLLQVNKTHINDTVQSYIIPQPLDVAKNTSCTIHHVVVKDRLPDNSNPVKLNLNVPRCHKLKMLKIEVVDSSKASQGSN